MENRRIRVSGENENLEVRNIDSYVDILENRLFVISSFPVLRPPCILPPRYLPLEPPMTRSRDHQPSAAFDQLYGTIR